MVNWSTLEYGHEDKRDRINQDQKQACIYCEYLNSSLSDANEERPNGELDGTDRKNASIY